MSGEFSQTTHFAPAGMIPAFNELGNHPTNMHDFVDTRVAAAYTRLGIQDKYPITRQVLHDAIDDLDHRSPIFEGHHKPSEATRLVSTEIMEGTFIRADECTLEGGENYETALDLLSKGDNVILSPNHTSPLDGLIPLTLFSKKFKGTEQPAIVMSQVFEYARISRLLTSGVEKHPVFQPKHMRRFRDAGQVDVVKAMHEQNGTTAASLHSKMVLGGKSIFLYSERDRNNDGMGVPEPAVSRLIEDLDATTKSDLHILPVHISGANTLFPNRPGVNEIDIFMENIQIGQGAAVCGKPIPFSRIAEAASSVDHAELVEATMGEAGKAIEDPSRRRLAALSIITLGLTANLSPTEEGQGIYRNSPALAIARSL